MGCIKQIILPVVFHICSLVLIFTGGNTDAISLFFCCVEGNLRQSEVSLFEEFLRRTKFMCKVPGCTHAHKHAHTRARMHAHTHMTNTFVCNVPSCMHAHACALTHARMHACTHART